MKLGDWLRGHDKTPTSFAAEIGVAKTTVGRWVDPEIKVMPHREHLDLISAATNGEVTAHDFIELTPQPNAPTLPERGDALQEDNATGA